MIADLKPYPVMKDSGVEWQGNVPEHWEVRRLKTVCSMQSGDGITATSIESSGVYPVYGGNGRRGYTSNYTHDGTFVLIGRQGALCGNVHIASGRFWASEHTVVTTPKVGHFPEWLGATLDAMNLNQYSIAAAQPGLSVERVLDLQVPVPNAPEQAAIVRFLDHVDRRIQRYIRAKQKLIALLEEQKQAVIHQAVTGQIDVRTDRPYPAYKDSGVKWLREVPEHWRLPRLGVLLRERGETNGDGQVSEVLSVMRDRGVIPYAEKGNIGNKKSDDITRYKVVRPDDIVVNCMNVIIGSVGLSRYTGCLSPVYYVLTRRSEYDHTRYLNAYFQTKPFQESLVRIGNGILAHRMRIPMELLKCEPFPRPPTTEQAAIVRYLDKRTAAVATAIGRARRQIDLLREYRTRLIADVVTGKLDVREAAARLPDEVEEPQPLDGAEPWSESGDDYIERSEALH